MLADNPMNVPHMMLVKGGTRSIGYDAEKFIINGIVLKQSNWLKASPPCPALGGHSSFLNRQDGGRVHLENVH